VAVDVRTSGWSPTPASPGRERVARRRANPIASTETGSVRLGRRWALRSLAWGLVAVTPDPRTPGLLTRARTSPSRAVPSRAGPTSTVCSRAVVGPRRRACRTRRTERAPRDPWRALAGIREARATDAPSCACRRPRSARRSRIAPTATARRGALATAVSTTPRRARSTASAHDAQLRTRMTTAVMLSLPPAA
jgi:hypothetical protein